MVKKLGRIDLIKKINRSLVLDIIRNEQPISRATIAKKLGLSRSTVSSIVDDLLQKKFVVEQGLGSSTREGGRRSVQLRFNPTSAYGIGVDIRGKKIVNIITDLDGNIIFERDYSVSNLEDELLDRLEDFINASNIEPKKFIAMGVLVPSIVDSKNGIVIDAPSISWKNFDLRTFISQKFDFPILIHNDVNGAALGENWLGAGKNTSEMVYISITDHGVGSAIISNGQLIHGFQHSAGEVGYYLHQEDVDQNQFNQFGNFGVFERKVSRLFEQQEKIDILLAEAFTVVVSNIISLLNPQKIIIGGDVVSEQFIEKLSVNVAGINPIQSKIEMASLGQKAGALGAIAHAFEHVQEESLL
ncbi:ROK family transcriptional regulator [Ferviditalea candida]|uniref:ROK family transcriptional regulator n=1 Tax=Ferviditalea candida TaxID=3108399 RepID=A0ABU5ZQ14_9BACL|nr:ROK family transcriptional regulator [Paenibacillaceae bacterium T2]